MGTHLYDCLNSFERMLEGHQELSKEVLKKFGGHVQCNRCKRKLQVAQNKVIRFIKQLGPRERITNAILSELNLVNVDTRVKQLKLNHVHKIVNNKCPSYMKDNFVSIKDTHRYHTRASEHNFIIPNCQGSISNTFYYSAIKDWNGLPDSIKSIKDSVKFKFEVKKFLQLQKCV